MLKNGQTYFKNFAVWTPQDFLSMCSHFSTWKKGLKYLPTRKFFLHTFVCKLWLSEIFIRRFFSSFKFINTSTTECFCMWCICYVLKLLLSFCVFVCVAFFVSLYMCLCGCLCVHVRLYAQCLYVSDKIAWKWNWLQMFWVQ